MDLKIKVCGMASQSNMSEVSALAPDYMGFIFHEPSPRNAFRLSAEAVKDLADVTEAVGVFVNRSASEIVGLCDRFGIDTVQLHGSESPDLCLELKERGYAVWKAVGIGSDIDWRQLEPYRGAVDCFVFDTKSPKHGGTGQKYDWSILKSYHLDLPFMLSGGIAPGDVEPVCRIDHPMFAGVDINSRFELSPGIKDINSLRIFINSLRNHE